MNIKDIDCSVLDDKIAESYRNHQESMVDHIMTDMIEGGIVDKTWGSLIYNEDGGYNEVDGVACDEMILKELEQHIAEFVKNARQ